MQYTTFKMSPISTQCGTKRALKVEPLLYEETAKPNFIDEDICDTKILDAEYLEDNYSDLDENSCKPEYLDDNNMEETPISNETYEDFTQVDEKQYLETENLTENLDNVYFHQTKMIKNPVQVKQFEEQCDCEVKLFKTKSEQIDHYKSRKMKDCYVNCEFQCQSCLLGFNKQFKYDRHLLLRHDIKNKYVCDICTCRFRNKHALRTHRNRHSITISCLQCPYVSLTNTQAKAHFNYHSGVTYDCKYCDLKYDRSNRMFAHMKAMHTSEMVSCDMCGELFVSEKGVNNHKHLFHSKDEEFLEDKYKLYDDEKLYEKPYQCEMCDQSFYNEQSKMVHMKRKHSKKTQRSKSNNKKTEDKSVVCDICGKVVRCPAMLTFHQTIHTGEKPHKCNICHKKFRQKLMLKQHEWKHTGVKSYTCDKCNTQFTSPMNLQKHLTNKHSGIRRLCYLCGKDFSSAESMKLHLNTLHFGNPQRKNRMSNTDA